MNATMATVTWRQETEVKYVERKIFENFVTVMQDFGLKVQLVMRCGDDAYATSELRLEGDLVQAVLAHWPETLTGSPDEGDELE